MDPYRLQLCQYLHVVIENDKNQRQISLMEDFKDSLVSTWMRAEDEKRYSLVGIHVARSGSCRDLMVTPVVIADNSISD